MAKKSNKMYFSRKTLGITLIVALFLEYVLPAAGIGSLASIGVLLYILVALALLFL